MNRRVILWIDWTMFNATFNIISVVIIFNNASDPFYNKSYLIQ